jgi:uncharacterized protein (UPF0335 family)
MANYGGIAGEQLRQYIQKIERLEQEKADIASDIRDAYAEAKGNGFEPKVMRQLIKIRKMDQNERSEHEELLDIYKHALGMIPGAEEEAA